MRAHGEREAPELTARVHQILNRRPCVGLGLGVVRGGRLELFYGHGLADMEARTPITQDTVFRIASITKTFTAIAVAQLWERGLIDLDAPANDYLRAYRLVPADPRSSPATVRQLLTHTAGVPQIVRPWRALKSLFGSNGLARLTEGGASFDLQQHMPTLAEYYSGAIRLEAEPGTRFTYGDHGYASLGQIVEDVSGRSLDRYFREEIFGPLGMTDSDLLRSDRVRPRLATGYVLGSDGPRPVKDRQWVTAAASNIYSTPADMARYLEALVGGGANEHGRVLRAETMAAVFQPQHQTDPRVGGIGLGFMVGHMDGHLTAEHQGILPGFDSQIYLAPDDGIGVMVFSNGTRQGTSWMPGETSDLLCQLLGISAGAARSDVPQRPDVWSDLCGWYPLTARLTDTQLKSVVGLGAEVVVQRGQLRLRTLSPIPAMFRGFVLQPDDPNDPFAYRIDLSRYGIGMVKVVFSRHPGGVTRIHSDWIPHSLTRQPLRRSPRRWISRGLAAAVGIAAVALVRGSSPHARLLPER
jgi:CubicO group peptidase (beta-lactamase class C family)